MKIEGVPEGWELVAIATPVKGEWFINSEGGVVQANFNFMSLRPIIRKIEKPKRYRPFANAEEFKPHRNRWVRSITQCPENNSNPITGAGKDRVWIGPRVTGWDWDNAFYNHVFDDDGTPFGVEVTDEE